MAAVALCLLVGVAGCADPDEPEVRQVAGAFAADGPQRRCDLLAPDTLSALVEDEGTACPEAVGGLPLGSGAVESVEVWGEDALVHLSDDVLFLTRTDAGWRVSAAGCVSRGEAPYRCRVEGS